MRRLNFNIDPKKCVHCNACIADCPRQIIQNTDTVPSIPDGLADTCIACQHCLAVCPSGALSIFGYNPQNSIDLKDAVLPSPESMEVLIRARRSVRQYSKENVSSPLINKLLSAVANSPTGCNDMGLTFTVIDGREAMLKFLLKIVEELEASQRSGREIPEFVMDAVEAYRSNGSDYVFRGASNLLIVSAKTESHCPNEDVVIALSYFELLSQSAGLGTTWCGYLKFIIDSAPELRNVFGLKPGQTFYAMMFGKPSVHYARTVQRDTAAEIQMLKL